MRSDGRKERLKESEKELGREENKKTERRMNG